MKQLRTVTFFVMVGIAFSSCTKNESSAANASGNTNSIYTITANIGGTPFSRDSCLFHMGIPDTTNAEVIGWAGYPTTKPNYYPQIYLNLVYDYHGVGTYTFSNPGNNSAQLLTSSTTGEYAVDGSITITSIYPTVQGSFSFTTLSGVKVTNGSFVALRK